MVAPTSLASVSHSMSCSPVAVHFVATRRWTCSLRSSRSSSGGTFYVRVQFNPDAQQGLTATCDNAGMLPCSGAIGYRLDVAAAPPVSILFEDLLMRLASVRELLGAVPFEPLIVGTPSS